MTEQKRGCGYRKIGGIYLIGGRLTQPCGRLPMPLHICPTCNQGIKQSRGWTWVRPVELLAHAPLCKTFGSLDCVTCGLNDPAMMADEKGRCGLLWIGESFYKTPEEFTAEGSILGVCRRVKAPPRGVEVGKTWVMLAHPKAYYYTKPAEGHGIWEGECLPTDGKGPGIFTAFRIQSIEKCVTAQEMQDEAEMDKLRERNITPVVLPDEPKHRGSVHEKDDDE